MNISRAQAKVEEGAAAQRAGRLDEARQCYLEALSGDPEHPPTHYLLGLVLLDQGQLRDAIWHLATACILAPADPLYHFKWGEAYSRAAMPNAAVACFRRASELDGSDVQYRFAVAITLQNLGQPGQAAEEYRKLLAIDPDSAGVHNNLGNCLSSLGAYEEAIEHLTRAIQLDPGHAQGYGNLANVLHRIGRHSEAREYFQQALALDPASAVLRFNYGNLLQATYDLNGAIEQFREALKSEPNLAAAWNNMGNSQVTLGRLGEARASLQRVIELQPEQAGAYSNLGNVEVAEGNFSTAIELYQKDLALNPGSKDAASNLLYALNFPGGLSDEQVYREHVRYGQVFSELARLHRPTMPSRNGRKLRVGYVSGDFRRHSVAYFLLPLLQHHDRGRFEIFCYSNVAAPDPTSQQIMATVDQWRNIFPLDDRRAAELIARDAIDVLVDLSGHTSGNRLGVFSYRPAPAQLNWLGYPNTTAHPCIEYRVVDAVTDPVGAGDTHHTETLLRLAGGFLCYQPPEQAPPVADRSPLERNGYLTLGSFNNLTKVTADVMAYWAEVLHGLPEARLLLKSSSSGNEEVSGRVIAGLEQLGIDRQRIRIEERTESLDAHLAMYNEMDVALDTVPYNGTTTTCEALWMGVPVVSIPGHNHRSRVSASVLIHAGFPEFVANDRQVLLEILRRLCASPRDLSGLKQQMRERLSTSPLFDADRLAREMEAVYVTACESAGAGHVV